MRKIPFNQPYLTGKEAHYIYEAVYTHRHISGNGIFTKKCHDFFENKYGLKKCLMTTSCTDALEMAAILLDIKPDDEIIIPAYTFVSTANAFVLHGAKIIFADSEHNNPNIDLKKIESLITSKTKAIVVVHYAGIACDMDEIMAIASKHNLFVVEDAAQAVDSYYKGKILGSIGHLGAYSFHETKNVIAGEGGLLIVNDERFIRRSEIIWEKGTNRAEFFRGEVNKYGWVDVGSSFLPSDIISAYLYAQLESINEIQNKRKQNWNNYYQRLNELEIKEFIKLPVIPNYATNNGHMFYLVCNDLNERTALINYLKSFGIMAVFHYLSLHKSDYYVHKHDGRELNNCDMFADCLVRLPMYYDLTEEQIDFICSKIKEFYLSKM